MTHPLIKQGVQIFKVSLAEIPQLQQLCRTTFYDAFASQNKTEHLQEYMDRAFTIEKLTQEWNHPESLFFFAKLTQQQQDTATTTEEQQDLVASPMNEENFTSSSSTPILGYLKVNWGSAQTESQNPNGLEIERIYVSQTYHGMGVGSQLFQTALDVAKQQQTDCVWLGVWEKNEPALRFYKKHGFTTFDRHTFLMGTDEQTDFMMKRNIEL